MRFNNIRKENLTIYGRTSDKVETFLNLGSVVNGFRCKSELKMALQQKFYRKCQ